MKSKLFSWSGYDVLKGAITAFLTSGLTALSQQLDIGHIPTWAEGRVILIAGVAAFVGYMLKNFFSNSEGKIAAGENKTS
jgi:glycerol-3-phosphate acyltransferase PlsY